MTSVAPASTATGPKPKPKLEDQAAIAALYVTKNSGASKNEQQYLDSNNKLSSAGAAASLKYANPQDLPSFPSYGLRRDDSAAGAAASLGWANQKPFEHWKPDPSASASAAAMLAKDYKMKPLWQPEQSSSGARAAVLAHRENAKVDIWKPEASNWGNSAANQAFKKAGTTAPTVQSGNTWVNKQGSLQAATGAMSTSRKRAESTPIQPLERYPDERNASGNALKAAMSVHRRQPSDTVGGSTPYTNMSREMYTSHPPVAPEVEELNRQNTLRASSVAMAKGLYAQQQKVIDAAKASQSGAGAKAAHKRSSSVSSDDPQGMYLGNVEEAARKLAQERLAKLHSEHTKNRETVDYREYYGHKQPQSRLSIRGRTRQRASSDGTYDEDREQSNKIRTQMSMFSNKLSEVDEQKRTKDRESLIAIAQRNVTKSLHGMDERVFADTGKVAPSLLSEWELKAHKAAQAKSDTRMENYGKVDIGGGKFVNQSAVDLIAARNVQPVLDEINEKAQIERERQAAIKAEQLEQQRKAEVLKQREKENKEINKKLKQQDKEEERARKAEEKAVKDEEKRVQKEKRKSAKAVAKPTEITTGATATEATTEHSPTSPLAVLEPKHTNTSEPGPTRTSVEDETSRPRENADKANADNSAALSPSTSPKEGNGVKGWFKSKLSTRRQSKSAKSSEMSVIEKTDGSSKPFVGGAALTGGNQSTTSLGGKSSSIRDVALAGKGKETETTRTSTSDDDDNLDRSPSRNSDVSELSSSVGGVNENDEFLEAQDNFDEDLIPTPVFPSERKDSPMRDSKFKEEI